MCKAAFDHLRKWRKSNTLSKKEKFIDLKEVIRKKSPALASMWKSTPTWKNFQKELPIRQSFLP